MSFVRLQSCTFVFLAFLVPALAFAQQTGSIQGKVVDASGAVLPGVTVEAKSNVLPTPRSTVTGSDGVYQLPALPPGNLHGDVHALRIPTGEPTGGRAAR
jgi:hypothetical protein